MAGEVDAAFSTSYGVTQLANAATGIKIAGRQEGNQITVLIYNSGAATVAVAYAALAALALTNAVVPASAATSAAQVIVLGAGVTMTVTAAPGQFWSASGAGVFVQPGTGI